MKRTIFGIVTGAMLIGGSVMWAQDTTTPPPPPNGNTIRQREANQQKRIGEGVENGSLTPKETQRLEGKEAALNHEIRHDRKENGGNLTNKEKAQITRQQNRLSKQIYKQKHDGQGK